MHDLAEINILICEINFHLMHLCIDTTDVNSFKGSETVKAAVLRKYSIVYSYLSGKQILENICMKLSIQKIFLEEIFIHHSAAAKATTNKYF